MVSRTRQFLRYTYIAFLVKTSCMLHTEVTSCVLGDQGSIPASKYGITERVDLIVSVYRYCVCMCMCMCVCVCVYIYIYIYKRYRRPTPSTGWPPESAYIYICWDCRLESRKGAWMSVVSVVCYHKSVQWAVYSSTGALPSVVPLN